MKNPNAIRCVLAFVFLCSTSALEWTSAPGHRWAALKQAAPGGPGFTRMPPDQTGITFANLLSTNRYRTNQNILNGSGVAAGDIDGDGTAELFFCGLDSPNALYKWANEWRFTNIAGRAGVDMPQYSCTGAAFADLDGDHDLDLIVNTFGEGTHLFENRSGSFTRRAELNPIRAGMSLALADTDGDSDLDLYITNYRVETVRDDPGAEFNGDYFQGRRVLKSYNNRPLTEGELIGRFYLAPDGRISENGEVDRFYRNDGNWNFTEIPFDTGAFLDENGQKLQTIPRDWGLSCMFRDLNGDFAPDLYVCNDFDSPDRIWINDGKGVFWAIDKLAIRHTSKFSMGVDFADVNRDGLDDFFVCEMLSRSHTERNTRAGITPNHNPVGEIDNRPQYVQNSLFINRGDGTYSERAFFAGVEASDWSWATAFLDVDLDGFEDILVTTGNQLDSLDTDLIEQAELIKKQRPLTKSEILDLRLKLFPPLRTPNVAFRNLGNGRFTDASSEWSFNESGVSQGMCFADLDGDGDLDVAINNLNGPAGIYRNEVPAPRIAVRLRGTGNTQGIGARIRVSGATAGQSQEMISGGRYLSGDEPLRVFAARDKTEHRIEIAWRSGIRSVVENALPGRVYEIDEATAESPVLPRPSVAQTWFEDVSHLIKHKHIDQPYEDFERQPLLPYRLSQLGPGVLWHDFNADNALDLIVGSGRGGSFAVYRNQNGALILLTEPFLQRPLIRDQNSLAGLGPILIAANSNWEDALTNRGAVRIYQTEQKASGESLPGFDSTTGPLALADVDADGLPELFVGGRAIAGRYPEPASSVLYRSDGPRYVPKQRFEKLGLVTGAVFADLDGDSDPDLALSTHWGSVRLFRNDRGNFIEFTAEAAVSAHTGLWNGIAAADFNNDGLADIVVSNWGLNTPWRASGGHPLKLYYGDFDANGVLDMIEARFDPALQKEVPLRSFRSVSVALPSVAERFKSHRAYGRASMPEILGDKVTQFHAVTTLNSALLLNRGGKFDFIPLPDEAQISPAFGIAVADIDGDKNLDLFLAQNFFQSNAELPRSDGGAGALLRGDGKGNFEPVAVRLSGLAIHGEQRNCAFGDFDKDGQPDLVVTQNGGPTRLFRNRIKQGAVR